MKLFQYYRNAALYPAMFVLFFSIVYSLLYNFNRGDLSNLSAMLMVVIPALIYSVLMSVLSLAILLNNIERISRNKILNILTWFLLPVVYVTIVFIHDIKIRTKYEFGFGNDFVFLLIMTTPFIVGLSWTFKAYRQMITTGGVA